MMTEAMNDEIPPEVIERLQPGRFGNFDDFYKTTPPWDIGRPQTVFAALAESGAIRGRVLDVGCGTGEHALMAAALGCDSVGVDVAATAIAHARRKAVQRELDVRFEVADATALPDLGGAFHTVLDSALFHVYTDAERIRYAAELTRVTRVGGRLYLLCFSDRQPGDVGPRRVRSEELRSAFAEGWRTDAIELAVLEILDSADGVQAWLGSFTRVA